MRLIQLFSGIKVYNIEVVSAISAFRVQFCFGYEINFGED